MRREGSALSASVVIAAQNDLHALHRVLAALERQTLPSTNFEVILVTHGALDGPPIRFESVAPALAVRSVEAREAGRAEALNIGAAAAGAPLLVFLAADAEPAPHWLQSHVAAHKQESVPVAVGASLPVSHACANQSCLSLRNMLEAHFDRLARSERRLTYRDTWVGNLSIPVDLWRSIGGLDEQLGQEAESYDLGARLVKANIGIAFAGEAIAYRHFCKSPDDAYRRCYSEGASDIVIGEKHPELRSGLRITQQVQRASSCKRILHSSLFRRSGMATSYVLATRGMARILQKLKLRTSYTRLDGLLRDYWYVRGAADRVGSLNSWCCHDEEGPIAEPTKIELDLREGIPAAEQRLDSVCPSIVNLRYGTRAIGVLPYEAGTGPWRGAHLRPHLADRFRVQYLRALAEDGAIIARSPEQCMELAAAIEQTGRLAETALAQEFWGEQRAQWRTLAEELGVNLR